MVKPVCPLNFVLVQIDKKYQDVITTPSGIQFYKETRFNPGWHATITGKVVSTPQSIMNDAYHRGLSVDVKEGDVILFSYRVVYDERYTGNNDEVFYENESFDPYEKVWQSKKGEVLVRRYMNNDRWNCLHMTREGEIISAAKMCNERQMESFLGKFTYKTHTDISFKNLITIDGKDYWKVDVANIIAVKNGEHFEMKSGNVMLEEHKKREVSHQGKIILLSNPYKPKNQSTATVLSIGKQRGGKVAIGAKPGDEVYYDKRFAEQYEIEGKEFIILKQERILAKVV